MKSILVVSTLLLCTIIGCKNNNGTDGPTLSTDSNSATSISSEPFYPISQYIQQQIAYVDSTPLAIEKHTYINNRRVDSFIISRDEFRQLAADFSSPDLNLNAVKPLYGETVFEDKTINTLTFSYNAKDPNQELQQRDILLDPETKRVRNVMFRKVEHKGDTTITQNGLWKHNMNFQLNYIIEPAHGPMQTKQIKVIWDRPIVANN